MRSDVHSRAESVLARVRKTLQTERAKCKRQINRLAVLRENDLPTPEETEKLKWVVLNKLMPMLNTLTKIQDDMAWIDEFLADTQWTPNQKKK